ncbi:MBL fold metallo-hydrolase [Rugamonas apoptosis]|uniref:MBL fold metallo-hydrolase n=1 Tax=Rugamonas apoptosis TaxID=2758570 RepID=A0A7W2F601_9BURK|nr:MBL fold metallo-hydrolase [Rugamonas apoptosis]MBA5685752.1 MBL fold metallo-hydrolase [Rugamonas apoptosis]
MTTATTGLNATLSKYHQKDGKYRNPARMRKGGLLKSLGIVLRFLFAKPANTVPSKPLPVHALSAEQLFDAEDNSLFRLGHSTLLLKLGGQFWLTDPVFSERASPVQWAGPQRFHAPPITIADLPPIHGVILSHDHYDHLDKAAVLALAERTTHFVAPLGVGDTLVSWGIPASKVHQLDWWQSKHLDGVKLVATPAQHFSGRSMFDGNSTLWSSWVIETAHTRIFFSGDSGYFKGFKEIGDIYGPFDLTMIETGAYDPQWPDVHMQPEESLQAHVDLRGKVLLPIHNGTFDLALHAWHEPFERIVALARERGLPIAMPAIGKALSLTAPEAAEHWWLHAK